MCLNNVEKNILKREPDSAELSSQEHSLLRYQESECMLLLDEKIKGYPSLIDKWQMDLIQVYLPLEEAERKMKVFYSVAGVITFLILTGIGVLFFTKTVTDAMVLFFYLILILGVVDLVFLCLALKATVFYGMNHDWQLFQIFSDGLGFVSIKKEIDSMIRGKQQMQKDLERAKDDKERLLRQECLSPEEFAWASAPLEMPLRIRHTENVFGNIGKRKDI